MYKYRIWAYRVRLCALLEDAVSALFNMTYKRDGCGGCLTERISGVDETNELPGSPLAQSAFPQQVVDNGVK